MWRLYSLVSGSTARWGTTFTGLASPNNPYRAWIDTYAGEEFSAAVDAIIGATDAVAVAASPSQVEAMHKAFTRAMQLEWMFWDSAYRLECWPI